MLCKIFQGLSLPAKVPGSFPWLQDWPPSIGLIMSKSYLETASRETSSSCSLILFMVSMPFFSSSRWMKSR